MDLLSAIFDLFGIFIPPKDDRGRRWHRIGCFVALCLAAVVGVIGCLIYLRSVL